MYSFRFTSSFFLLRSRMGGNREENLQQKELDNASYLSRRNIVCHWWPSWSS